MSADRDDGLRRLLPIFAIAVVWWLCFLPGFYSRDSFGTLEQASSGHITVAFTAIWPLFVRVVTGNGRFPAIATLINVLLFVYAVAVWSAAVLPRRAIAPTTTIMVATPLVGAIGITLWHDVPMTSGFLLIAAAATSTRWFALPPSRRDRSHLATGAILSVFRPNGLPTLAAFLVVVIAFTSDRRRAMRSAAACGAVAVVATVLALAATANHSLVSGAYAQEWMRADLSCALARDGTTIDGADKARLATLVGLEVWANGAACVGINPLPLDASHLEQSLRIVPAVWRDLALGHAPTTLAIHAERNAYLLPLPRPRAFHVPFIHSTIELPDRGVAWAWPGLASRLRAYPRAWNAARGVFAFAGAWLAVSIVLLCLPASTRMPLGPTVALSICLTSIVFVTAPIADARYALFVLVTGQSALLGVAVDGLSRRGSARWRREPARGRRQTWPGAGC